MANWDEKNGLPFLPNLGEKWRLVHRSQPESRLDRPDIPIPNLMVFEISVSEFERYHFKYRGEKFGCIDFETWRDFTKPNLCSFLFYRSYERNKTHSRVGMKPVEVDGVIPTGFNGWPLHWEDATERWKKDENGEPIKPKTYGRRKTGESDTVQVAVGWLWNDEVAEHWPKLCRQMGATTIYAHNASVDIIALLSLLMPKLHHPLLHFTSKDQKERSRILFKGSSILTCTFDLAPFFPEKDWSEERWNYREKKPEVMKDYPIEIRDSMGLMPMGLKALGECVGYTNTETPEMFTNALHPDFENFMAITPDMVRYAVDDCVMLWLSLLEMWNLAKELNYHGKSMPLTIGGLGFQMNAHAIAKAGHKIVHKKKSSWKYRTVHNRPDLDSICRDTLVGGMVRVFNDEPVETSSFGIDANSMYASVELLNDRWPDFTRLSAVLYTNAEDSTVDLVIEKEGAIHVHWKRPKSDLIGAVASRDIKTGNLVWTEMEGTRWITLIQARFLIDRGYILTPIPFIYERTTVTHNPDTGEAEEGEPEVKPIYAIVCPRLSFNPFEEVRHHYERRLQMKKEGDPREKLVKFILTAGSFGKWVELNTETRIATEADWTFEFSDWEFSSVLEIDGEMIGYVKNPIPKRAGNTANILGAYITDYARMNLLTLADQFPFESLIYCDTDSLKINLPLEEARQYIPDGLIGRGLGQWSVEHEMDFFHALKPKQYKAHYISKEDTRTGELVECDIWKLRIKGVNIRGVILKMWRDEHKFGLPTDDYTLSILKNLKLSDRMIYERLIGIRESFRRGLEAGEWMEQSKQLRQTS